MGNACKVMVCAAILALFWQASELPAQSGGPQSSSKAPSPAEGATAQLARRAKGELDHGDVEGAMRDYETVVKMAPNDVDYLLGLAIAYFSAGRPQDSVTLLQQSLKLKPGDPQARYFLAASLAETGQCAEAMSYFKKAASHLQDQDLKRNAETTGLGCAMALQQDDDAVDFLRMLKHDFPKDPQVLYLSVHVYSDLSTLASQRLLMSAPASYQVHELYAETLEMQDKWDEAEAEYRRVLAIDPHLPGIHFRIGRLLLSEPRTPTTKEKAKREFEEELKIDPRNPGAEYVLGEIARQDRDFPQAIEHFTRASQLDPTMVDAFIGLGKSLVAEGRVADAIAPLEHAVKLQPENPVAHYQLAFAYRRTGRTGEAETEIGAYRKANDAAQQDLMDLRTAVTGQQIPAQTAEPPE